MIAFTFPNLRWNYSWLCKRQSKDRTKSSLCFWVYFLRKTREYVFIQKLAKVGRYVVFFFSILSCCSSAECWTQSPGHSRWRLFHWVLPPGPFLFRHLCLRSDLKPYPCSEGLSWGLQCMFHWLFFVRKDNAMPICLSHRILIYPAKWPLEPLLDLFLVYSYEDSYFLGTTWQGGELNMKVRWQTERRQLNETY